MVEKKRKIWPGFLAVAGAAALVTGSAAPAQADTSPGSTTAHVQVSSEILLTGLTPSFTLAGDPGDTVTSVAPVTMTVTTNNFTGYSVTVGPAVVALTGATVGNTDTIPSSALQVKETAAGTYANLGINAPVTVFTKATASAPTGDPISTTFRITIPFVQPDTYSGAVNYIATTAL
jgi:hypothetical protein